jgi:hypothetical protein
MLYAAGEKWFVEILGKNSGGGGGGGEEYYRVRIVRIFGYGDGVAIGSEQVLNESRLRELNTQEKRELLIKSSIQEEMPSSSSSSNSTFYSFPLGEPSLSGLLSREGYVPNILQFLPKNDQRNFKVVSKSAKQAAEEYLREYTFPEPSLRGLLSRGDYVPNILKFLPKKEQRGFKLVSRPALEAAEDYLGDRELLQKLKQLLDTPIPPEFRVPPPEDFLSWRESLLYDKRDILDLTELDTLRKIFIYYSTLGRNEYALRGISFIQQHHYITQIFYLVFIYFGILDGEIITNRSAGEIAALNLQLNGSLWNPLTDRLFHIISIIPGFTVIIPYHQPRGINVEWLQGDFLYKHLKILHILALTRPDQIVLPLAPVKLPITIQQLDIKKLKERNMIREKLSGDRLDYK